MGTFTKCLQGTAGKVPQKSQRQDGLLPKHSHMAALQPDPGHAILRQAEVRRVNHANRLQPPRLFPLSSRTSPFRAALRSVAAAPRRAGRTAPTLRPARAAPAEFPSRGTLTARGGAGRHRPPAAPGVSAAARPPDTRSASAAGAQVCKTPLLFAAAIPFPL